MPKGKKGKGNDQDRIEKKIDKQRQAAENQRLQKYSHIRREIKYGTDMIAKHEKNWRSMLLEIAMPRVRAELEYCWQNFERVVDAKDFTISLLLDELKEADEQYTRNMQGHMDNIDTVITICYDQIGELWDESRNIISNLYQAATYERADVTRVIKEHEDYLKTMLYMLDVAKKETRKLVHGEYLSQQEVEISKLNEIASKIANELKARFEKMWSEAENFLKVHVSEYAVRNQALQELTDQDNEMQKLIRRTWENIATAYDRIKQKKIYFNELQLTHNRKVDELSHESKYYEGIYRTLKKRAEVEREIDLNNLTLLTLSSNNIVEYLGNYEVQGEKLLALSAMCRKLETKQEKTMSFPIQNFPMLLETKKVAEPPEETQYLPELKLFWNRVAEIDSSRYKLAEQSEVIRKENERLKLELFKYCECLNCEPQMEYMYQNHAVKRQ